MTQYRVCSAAGTVIAIHERLDGPDGKRMYWCQPDGSMGLAGTPLADLPLYGTEHVGTWDPDRPVLVTEGEKAAQALLDAGYAAVGTVTGASSTPGPEALAVLANRRVVLWPDNDRVGSEHMTRVAERLRGVAATVHTIDWASAPPHGDAADYLTADMVDVTIEDLMGTALGLMPAPAIELRPGATGMDAVDLLGLDLPPLRWVVPDLLPEGTTILAAPPKVGKSCLIYQIAVEASIGGDLFDRRVEPGSVLYLALEDGQRRGQDRLRTALDGRTMPRGRLEVRWSAPAIGHGLEEELTSWLDGHDDAIMVAIDTLQKVRPRSDGRRNAYEVDVADLGRLQAIFRNRPVALVIVHHASKAGSDDFLASVSGTYGITGSADTTMVVRRKRAEAFGAIVVTGRDVPDFEQPVRFDEKLWHAAPKALAEASFERAEVFEVIRRAGPIFPQAIGDELGLSRTSVQNMVTKLVAEGVVVRVPKGYAAVALDADEPGQSLPRARAGVGGGSDDSLTPSPQSSQSLGIPAPTRAIAREDDESVAGRYQASLEEQLGG